ncbi:MAG: hypothetical protein ACN4E2_04380 [Nitrospinota bacterium]
MLKYIVLRGVVNLAVWLTNNWLRTIGAILTVGSIVILSIFLLLYFLSSKSINPYFGAIGFLVLPFGVIVGLGLIAVSHFLYKDKEAKDSIILDEPSDIVEYKTVSILIAGTLIFVAVAFIGGIEAMNFADSTKFCGETCHSVMEPQAVAHNLGPHSTVPCVDCHVGEGVAGMVEAKSRGMLQVVSILFKHYDRPILTSTTDIPSTSETCLNCHKLEKDMYKKMNVYTSFGNDKESSKKISAVLLDIGGSSDQGPHFHVADNLEIRYYADDKSGNKISWVEARVDGNLKRWELEGSNGSSDNKGSIRSFNCIDCHNRTGHPFKKSGSLADKFLVEGLFSEELPYAKPKLVSIIENAAIIDRDDRESYISNKLQVEWPTANIDLEESSKLIEQEVSANYYKDMNITWSTYKDNLGHDAQGEGCYRCHNQRMKDKDGNNITQSCDSCHAMIADNIPAKKWNKILESNLNTTYK